MSRSFKSNLVLHKILLLVVFFGIVFLIYSNTLENPFIFDDDFNIQNNSHIRLLRLTFGGLKRAGFESPSSNRPVSNISFALNYYFHQYNLFGYHLVNILIHITTGIFLYLFIKISLKIYPLNFLDQPLKWIPFFAALIWLVHPLQTQAVTYIVQRMSSLAAMFYVLSFLLYAKARLEGKRWVKVMFFAGCTTSGILAIGSKETSVTLPFFIFLYEWYFLQDLDRAWLKRHLFHFAAALIFIFFVSFLFLGGHPIATILSGYATRDFTLIQRVLTEFRVVIFYVSLILFPHPSRMNLDHDFSISFSLIDPVSTLFSMILLAGAIGLAVYLAKKDRLISFCILWFLGNLLIESSIIGLEIAFEHRTYLPSMFVNLLLVILFYRYVRREWLRVVILCLLVGVFSVWTYTRNSVWQSGVSLWRDCVEKSPHKARSHLNFGNALVDQGLIDDAITHYIEALHIRPGYGKAHDNLGVALESQGRIGEAINHYLEALSIKPDNERAHNNLGNALVKQGEIDEAINHYLTALRIKPEYEKAHYNLGNILVQQGRIDEAIDHYLEALRIAPDNEKTHNNLGNALERQGRTDEAIGHYLKVLRINPDNEKVHYNLGVALEKQGRTDAAIDHYLKALRIKPEYEKAHYKLGAALAKRGRTDEAIDHYIKALRLKPANARAHNNLGVALEKRGQVDEAIDHYLKALRLKPDFEEAHNNLGLALERQDRIDEAIDHYLTALRLKPDFEEAHNNLGVALFRKGNIEGAIEHFQKALRLNPKSVHVKNNLNRALGFVGSP